MEQKAKTKQTKSLEIELDHKALNQHGFKNECFNDSETINLLYLKDFNWHFGIKY